MGDRIVVMLDGRILQVDTPLELYHRPVNRFVATFIGSPPMNILNGRIVGTGETLQFRTTDDHFILDIPSLYHTALTPYMDGPVALGLRPEDLMENAEQVAVPGRSLSARIDVVEPMGSEIYLYLDLAGQPITARVNARTAPPVNSTHVLDVGVENLHFFDPATDNAIR